MFWSPWFGRWGGTRAKWQWQPAPHDPNPPIDLEDASAPAVTGTATLAAEAYTGATGAETFTGTATLTAEALLGVVAAETFAGTGALYAEAYLDATGTHLQNVTGTAALFAEAALAATGIGGSDARPGRRIIVSFRDGVMPTAARTTGPLHLTLHRAPRGTTRTRR